MNTAAANEMRDTMRPAVSMIRVATEICRNIYTHITRPVRYTNN